MYGTVRHGLQKSYRINRGSAFEAGLFYHLILALDTYDVILYRKDKNNLSIIRMLILTLIYQFIIKGYGGKNDIRYI